MTSPRYLKTTPAYVSASDDERERLTILLHKRLDQLIDQEQQAGLNEQDRERLAAIHQQTRTDLADIRYGATSGPSGRSNAGTSLVARFLPTLAHKWHTRFGLKSISADGRNPCFSVRSKDLRWGG